jgi:hypothetical protein
MVAHSIKRTTDIANEVAQLLDETSPGDDDEVRDAEVNEPDLKESMVGFWLKYGGLWYQVQVQPETTEPPDEDAGVGADDDEEVESA